MDALKLDGNAAAGLLQEVFTAEITTARGMCSGCGAVEPIGAVSLYSGAGIVLRCPHCDTVLVKVVTDGARIWLDAHGVRALELHLPRRP
jgi:hypothetical protein